MDAGAGSLKTRAGQAGNRRSPGGPPCCNGTAPDAGKRSDDGFLDLESGKQGRIALGQRLEILDKIAEQSVVAPFNTEGIVRHHEWGSVAERRLRALAAARDGVSARLHVLHTARALSSAVSQSIAKYYASALNIRSRTSTKTLHIAWISKSCRSIFLKKKFQK